MPSNTLTSILASGFISIERFGAELKSSLKRGKQLKLLFILILAQLLLFSCASDEKVADTPEAAFKIAKELEEDKNHKLAITRYTEVKNKFPYSNYATEAELAIADVYFKTEEYEEAQVAYQNFRDFHPKHPKIDYVIFQTGLSYYRQIPDSIDRDISVAQDSIYAFGELIKKYPTSTYIAQARDYRLKALTMLNEKELYIADFYFKQKYYDSALSRYLNSYKKYSETGLQPRSLAGIIRSSAQLFDEETKKTYSDILIRQFPGSEEANEIKREVLK